MRNLTRLIAPKSLAVIGGGAWCEAISNAAEAIGFSGKIWPVHPTKDILGGRKTYQSVADIPGRIDAAFVGVNRQTTLGVIADLRAVGAGGAVCFASGFNEVHDGAAFQEALVEAAGDMPFLGPNCYGLINALDQTAIWPDQHGMRPVETGVAILAQSSNIALNLTMQRRGLPIGFLGTFGNQAQTGLAELAHDLLEDARITAIGLYVEGVADPVSLWEIGRLAHDKGIPVVALKTGRTDTARQAAVSHTAAMVGSDEGAGALLEHCGIARVDSIEVFLETLKLLHVFGALPSANIASLSCSGGEAALLADTARHADVSFPPLSARQGAALSSALDGKVTLANPLDYHTYIWRDANAMARAFAAMAGPEVDLVAIISDLPRDDLCDASDWDCVTEAAKQAVGTTGARYALLSSLPEGLPEGYAKNLLEAGIAPLCGFSDSFAAIGASVNAGRVPAPEAPWRARVGRGAALVDEAEAKRRLAVFGMDVPRGVVAASGDLAGAAAQIGGQVVLKAQGLAHKTELGAVVLNLDADSIRAAAERMPGDVFLVEEMAPSGVELLVSVLPDLAHGMIMTLGAGGTLAELLEDRVSLCLPVQPSDLLGAIQSLRISKAIYGRRGGAPAGIAPLLDAIDAIQKFVAAYREDLVELEINPLICSSFRAVAVDALLRLSPPPEAP